MEMNTRKPHVLIVDDTQKNIQVLGAILKKQEYQISVAMNGLQALKLLNKIKPDLILLDVMMPELDGFGTCKQLKADPELKDIPVIFLTAKVEIEDIVKGFELGAVDYVTKPFNHTELIERVKTHLELKMARERIASYADELKEWNEKLEDKLDEKTKEINDMNKILLRKNNVLESRDRILEFILSVHSLEESAKFILKELVSLVFFDAITVYKSGDKNQFVPHFGIKNSDTDAVLFEESIEGYPSIPGLSEDEVAAFSAADKIDVEMINEYSGFVPLIKDEKLVGYLLVDNTRSKNNLHEADLAVIRDFAPLIAIVEHDWMVMNSSDEMDSTLTDILDDFSQ